MKMLYCCPKNVHGRGRADSKNARLWNKCTISAIWSRASLTVCRVHSCPTLPCSSVPLSSSLKCVPKTTVPPLKYESPFVAPAPCPVLFVSHRIFIFRQRTALAEEKQRANGSDVSLRSVCFTLCSDEVASHTLGPWFHTLHCDRQKVVKMSSSFFCSSSSSENHYCTG